MFNNDFNSSVSNANANTLQCNVNNSVNESGNQQNKPNTEPIPFDQRKLPQITIKQIKSAKPPQPFEHLKIDGVEISQVFIIAQIVSMDHQPSHSTFNVNDFTGSLVVKKWNKNVNAEEKQSLDDSVTDDGICDEPDNLVEGQWVKIIGRINSYNGRCSINAFTIIPIFDFNEITYHFLECIYQHLENTSGHLHQDKQTNQNKNFNMVLDADPNNKTNENDISHKTMEMSIDEDYCFSMIQKKVLDVISGPEYNNNEIGCNIEKIFGKLSDENINVNEIKEAIDSLSNDGYIYSTIDDDHYKYSGCQN